MTRQLSDRGSPFATPEKPSSGPWGRYARAGPVTSNRQMRRSEHERVGCDNFWLMTTWIHSDDDAVDDAGPIKRKGDTKTLNSTGLCSTAGVRFGRPVQGLHLLSELKSRWSSCPRGCFLSGSLLFQLLFCFRGNQSNVLRLCGLVPQTNTSTPGLGQ